MCLKLHHVRYTTRNSENIVCCFLVMKLVPTVVLETHINMSTALQTFFFDSKLREFTV